MGHRDILSACGLTPAEIEGGTLVVRTPVDGAEIARLKTYNTADIQAMIAKGVKAFESWRQVPAPRRGELVRLLGEELRAEKKISAVSSRSRPARSSRKAWARCRR